MNRAIATQSSTATALVAMIVGPLSGAVVAFAGSAGTAAPLENAVVTFVALLTGSTVLGREPAWAHLLPLMRVVSRFAGPVLGGVIVVLLQAWIGLPAELSVAWIAAVVATCAGTAMLAARLLRRVLLGRRRTRIAVIGSGRATVSLHRELQLAGRHELQVVGRVSTGGEEPVAPEVPTLGSLDRLGAIVEEHEVDLLLMTGDAPRLAVFDEVAQSCLHLPVRLRELAGFYEEVFGHVAVAEINTAWFQYIMHPRYRPQPPLGQRIIDVIAAAALGLAALPFVGVVALIIRRDGGPVFFRQVRIGEGGRPFTIMKLRTMREGVDGEWSTAEDERVTAIGRLLRRTHLDELPQVLNVLRGEMSIVGPRPEQPSFVDRLENVVPFYTRRHLIKPGLTGWAQIRCGYAGSDIGSAWKLCHDLYYLKHRSLWLNLLILCETARTLVADPQYSAEPASVDFILAPTRTVFDAVPAGISSS
ncbi:MAG TPA: exopolysaccharide biosynthesis polyprenyl glycosylphosphotransferase [Solirubrobacteraceae bacterium]|nr:exopolysaccharide biosynthesis polyprenyl glycosylphosphotransferase [Solirubrobacteraceae bacterium]